MDLMCTNGNFYYHKTKQSGAASMKQSALILMMLLLTSLLSGCVGIVDSETKEALMEIEKQHKANDISKPYDEIRATVVGGWHNDVINGSVEIFEPDAQIVLSPLTTIKINEGYGTSQLQPNNLLLYSRTLYKSGFDGKREHYDQWYKGSNEEHLPEYPTVTNTIPYTTLVFEDVVRVGTINN